MFYTQSVMLNPCFIPESVFYVQSIMLSPNFVPSPQSAVHVLDRRCQSTQTMPVPSICETTCFYYQTWDNYSVYEHDFELFLLWGAATDHFHFRKNETEDMLMHNCDRAKLELSVCRKCFTHNFVKTCLQGF